MSKSVIEKQRKTVREEVKKCLNEYGKCAFIRPTGWGKTWTIASLVDDYDKVLYIYPGDAIRDTFLYAYYTLHFQEVKKSIPNVKIMSYAGLRVQKPNQLKALKDIDLIIADECDILGAAETMRAMSDLLKYAKKAHFLGATATPERQDMIDEIAIFFEDHVISDYTLYDAFVDNIMKCPHYVIGCYDETAEEILSRFKRRSTMEVDKLNAPKDRKILGASLEATKLELANLLNMSKVIPVELSAAGIETDYQKYIVFFSRFQTLYKQKDQVMNWFKTAFPNHKIRTLEITSEDRIKSANVKNLSKLTYKHKTIDLIFNCNMLTAGYHVNDITGIIMMRGTTSNRIFTQQFGRVLSTGNLKPGIVFDVMDNLHRPANYSMCWDIEDGDETGDGFIVTKEEIREYEALVQKSSDKDEQGHPIILSMKERKRLIFLKKKIKKAERLKKLKRTNGVAKIPASEDMVVSSRLATAREVMGKAVAESVSMRCRQAWSRWLEKGGDDSIMTREFILSQQPPSKTPLPPFCKLKRVSVEAVLNEMGVV